MSLERWTWQNGQENYVENWWNAIRIQYVVILISAFSEVKISWRSWCDCCEIIVRINDAHGNPAQIILRLHVYKYADWNDYRKLLLVWIWEPDETFALVFEILHDALAGSQCTADDIYCWWKIRDYALTLTVKTRPNTYSYNMMLCQYLLNPFWNHWLSLQSDWLSGVRFIHESHYFLL